MALPRPRPPIKSGGHRGIVRATRGGMLPESSTLDGRRDPCYTLVMSAVAKLMTLDAFLDWESRQELKYEFDGFQPVAMTGGTAAHSRIQFNLMGLLFNALRGHRCQGHGSELKIQVAGRIRYPGAFIVCSSVSSGALVVHDPVVVFEILSPSTYDTGHFEKNLEYRDTPSIQRYVMLEQSCRGATVFSRAGDDWVGHVLTADDDLALPEVGISLSIADLYEGVTFPGAPGEALPV